MMNKTRLFQNHVIKILCIFIVFLFFHNNLIIAVLSISDVDSVSTGNSIKLGSGWHMLTGNGFGHNSNLATRGICEFRGELYVGTHNVHLKKIFEKQFPELLENISRGLPNILTKYLDRTLLFRCIFRVMHRLESIGMNGIVHAVVRESDGCEIWRYNYSTNLLMQVIGQNSMFDMDAGFGSRFNCVAASMCVFNEYLYVGTWNTAFGSVKNPFRWGGEVWRFDGERWEQVVGHVAPVMKGGFGNRNNVGIWCLKEFNDYLYAGTMNWDFSSNGGCEVWRSLDGVHWECVIDRGFRSEMSIVDLASGVNNVYAWSMEDFQNQLFVGTFNSQYRWISSIGMGCQLWKTDGMNWEKVPLATAIPGVHRNGFGKAEIYGIRSMVSYQDELYVGTAANVIEDVGCEIWRFDGLNWTPVISSMIPTVKPGDKQYSGFGNPLNKYVWSMLASSDGFLWVGTANGKFVNFLEPQTEGCELWRYDGQDWEQVIGKIGSDQLSGFGNVYNEGARSMIEFPKYSGNIVVGTFKLVSTRPMIPAEGCELWIRIK